MHVLPDDFRRVTGEPVSRGPLRVVIVDDNPDDRALARRELAREWPDVEVVEAGDAEALDRALDGAPELVITDSSLRFTDGLAVLRSVKERLPRCPVIMLTGTGTEETSVEAMKGGVDDYVLKQHLTRLVPAARAALDRAVEGRAVDLAERRYRELFENVPIGIFRVTPDGRVLDANPAVLAMFGVRSAAELEAGEGFSFADPEAHGHWRALAEEGALRGHEYEVRRADGTAMWLRLSGSAVRDPDGSVACYEAMIEDVTGKYEAATEMRLLQHAVEAAADAFIVTDRRVPERPIVYVNPAFERITGYALEEVSGRPVGFLYGPETDPARIEEIERAAAEARDVTVTLLEYRKDGSTFWMEVRLAYVRDESGAVTHVVGVNTDVSDEWRAIAALVESEERFRTLADSAPVMIWLADGEGGFTFVNRTALELTGRELEGPLGDGWLDDVHPDDRDRVRAAWERSFAARSVFENEHRLRHADGSFRWVLGRAVPRHAPDGSFLGYIGIGVDIHGRKLAESQLEETVSLLDALLESAPVGIAFLDTELRFGRVNPTLARINGLRLDEYEGKTTAELMPGIGEAAMRNQRQVLETGEALVGVEVAGEVPLRPGATSHFLTSYYPVFGAPGEIRGVGLVTLDVTERTRLEEQFLQAQKMEAVGQLAGGVAHDFNNLLTAINGYADLLLAQLGADHELRTEVEEIRAAGERAAGLTRQLLAFGRRQVFSPRVLDLNELVGNLEHMLRRVIGEDIELAVVSSAAPALVRADSGQLEQVVVNLVVNARDAIPAGGRVELAIRVLPGTHEVELSVTDTGSGIGEATRARIFEPFFTTKEVGKGTGLGLSTVLGIVEQSGGRISVESEPGRGASFRVALPRASGDGRAETGDAAARAGAGGTETILLVEDDPAVRELVRAVLADRGYTVLGTAGAQEAIDACAGHHAGIDVLLTDIVMPGVRGPELAEQIRLRCPGVRVVYMSGYADDVLAGGGKQDFLQKPFSAQDLAAKVREVLDR